MAACGIGAAFAARDGFRIAPDTATTFDVFSWLQVTNLDVSLLRSTPNGAHHINIFRFTLHGQLPRGNVHLHRERLTRYWQPFLSLPFF